MWYFPFNFFVGLRVRLTFDSFGGCNELFKIIDPFIHHCMSDFSIFFVALETPVYDSLEKNTPSWNVQGQAVFLDDLFLSLKNGCLNMNEFLWKILVNELSVEVIYNFSDIVLVLLFGALSGNGYYLRSVGLGLVLLRYGFLKLIDVVECMMLI